MPGCHIWHPGIKASNKNYLSVFSQGWLAMPQLVLASALAGGLAFAAAAVQQALSHIAGLESLDVLHKTVTPLYILELYLLYTGLGGLSREKSCRGGRLNVR